jgi:pSer/pThr/pTyr-binding forkhead associated (FHA) protein
VVPSASGPGLASQPAANRPARQLYVIFGNEWFEIDKDEYVIGRVQKFSDLVIKDAKMSRRHCSIVRRNDDYFMKDLGSTHGIEFKGARVDHHKIMEGSIYSLCNHELRFSFSPSGVD